MNWLETQALKFGLSQAHAKLGVNGMKSIGSVTLLIGGLISVLSGVESLLAHFTAGDLLSQACTVAEAAAWSGECPSNLIKCLGQVGAGLAVFSPGMVAFKSGIFARAPIAVQAATEKQEAKDVATDAKAVDAGKV